MPDPQPAAPPDDWTATVAQRIESAVGTVRDKTTLPILYVARVLVYGFLAAVAAATLVVLLTVMVLRLHVYLPVHPVARQVWISDAIVTGIFLLAGSALWKKRGSPGR